MSRLSGSTQIETGIKMLWSLAKIKFIEAIDNKKSNNPLLRVFFDSDLGSPVEKAVEQAYSMSTYEAIKDKLPNWNIADKAAKSLGGILGKLSAKVLDVAKLNYKYFKGQITSTQYTYEITKRTLCTAAAVIDKSWDWIGDKVKGGTIGILNSLGVPIETAEFITDSVGAIFNVVKEPFLNFIKSEKTAKFVAEGVQKVIGGIKKVINSAKEKIPPIVEKIADSIGIGVKKVVEVAKNTTSIIAKKAKEVGNWVWNKIKSIW